MAIGVVVGGVITGLLVVTIVILIIIIIRFYSRSRKPTNNHSMSGMQQRCNDCIHDKNAPLDADSLGYLVGLHVI